jgi:class 3 adenylate cyclase
MRRSLFRKYFVTLFAAVMIPVVAGAIGDVWFSYRDQRALLGVLLQAETTSAADRIQSFLDRVKGQLAWTVQQSWPAETESQHRLDALRAMRQEPAIVSITLVDDAGLEKLHVSRIDLDRLGSGSDRSADPAVIGARSLGTWYGPVTFRNGSEPFMAMALAGNRKSDAVVIAEINLKLIWTVVSGIRVGRTGQAFVVDKTDRLIAHPDISEVLQGTDEKAAATLGRLRDEIAAAGGEATATRNIKNEPVVATMAPIPKVDWTVFVEQARAEAFSPLVASLWRTGGLLLAAAILAGVLAYWLAKRMAVPIRLLGEGTDKIGAGQFEHRIDITTGDEFERLADRFNDMAEELAVSRDRSERIARLKRFLAPQVAELVEKSGDDSVLASQSAEVVAVFCDLRGFTPFSAHAKPDEIMNVLREYYAEVGKIITCHEATLTNFSADGLMVLVNAPVPCTEPALRAVQMAVDMQEAVQRLIAGWRLHGHAIGFGVGLAMGRATVGRIGYESRLDYTAIGHVVNLASRLCASAVDRQILVDCSVAEATCGKVLLVPLGKRHLKGFDEEVSVYVVETRTWESKAEFDANE